MDTGLHTIAVEPEGAGKTKVTLDGVDLSDALYGLDLRFRSGEPAEAMLAIAKGRVLPAPFEGLAKVFVQGGEPTEVIDDFLASVDPDLLEQAALEGLGLGDGEGSMAGAFLAVLRRWARGDE